MTLLFSYDSNNFLLNCSNGNAYLGVVVFHALGSIAPTAAGPGGSGSLLFFFIYIFFKSWWLWLFGCLFLV
jgi:hypothetical protein